MKVFAIYVAALSIYTGTIIGVAQHHVSQVAEKIQSTQHRNEIAQIRQSSGFNIVNSVKCFLDGVSIKSFYGSKGLDSKACSNEGKTWENSKQ